MENPIYNHIDWMQAVDWSKQFNNNEVRKHKTNTVRCVLVMARNHSAMSREKQRLPATRVHVQHRYYTAGCY